MFWNTSPSSSCHCSISGAVLKGKLPSSPGAAASCSAAVAAARCPRKSWLRVGRSSSRQLQLQRQLWAVAAATARKGAAGTAGVGAAGRQQRPLSIHLSAAAGNGSEGSSSGQVNTSPTYLPGQPLSAHLSILSSADPTRSHLLLLPPCLRIFPDPNLLRLPLRGSTPTLISSPP